MRRLLVLSLLVYLALDFGDPSMPGALNFDRDQSVEAVSTQPRGGAPVHTIAALVPGRHDDDLDRLLVTAVSSGGGEAALQTGKTLGAQVIGTSGSAEKLASTSSRARPFRPRSGTPDNEGFQLHLADTTWPIVVDCLQRGL